MLSVLVWWELKDIKILIADDEERMRRLINDYLKKHGYLVLEAANGRDALNVFYANEDLSLIILDVMMPEKDGFEVLGAIREVSKIPIIMLTAKGEERDELLGLNSGADEYITKPFSPKILLARIEAILRRSLGHINGEEALSLYGIVLDKNTRTVTIDGRNTELSLKEFDLLQYFMENPAVVLSRERILNQVWNFDYFGGTRTIDTHIKNLRSRMGEKGVLIKTVWGVGYKFCE